MSRMTKKQFLSRIPIAGPGKHRQTPMESQLAQASAHRRFEARKRMTELQVSQEREAK